MNILILTRTLTRRVIPKPSKVIPDVNTFLQKIGRSANELAPVYENNWKKLFTLKRDELKEKGVTPQNRKYVLQQVEKYRNEGTVMEIKKSKKSFFGGERHRRENIAKWRNQQKSKDK